jgi:hypothetical protein
MQRLVQEDSELAVEMHNRLFLLYFLVPIHAISTEYSATSQSKRQLTWCNVH